MAELQIPPSIDDARSRALLRLAERLGAIDLVPLLVYRLDSVPDSALPYLAWQFDILSPLWQMIAPPSLSIDALTNIDALINIDTLAEGLPPGSGGENRQTAIQRELLKAAIPLHRFRGTPWAIKNALATLGWPGATIVDGQAQWGGTGFPADQGWAVFRVYINLGSDQPVQRNSAEIAAAAIDFFKPARAWLDSLWFVLPAAVDRAPVPFDRFAFGGVAEYEVDTAPAPSDDALAIDVIEPPFQDNFGPATPIYDAHYRHSGITHGANQPAVADPALILNAAAVLYGG